MVVSIEGLCVVVAFLGFQNDEIQAFQSFCGLVGGCIGLEQGRDGRCNEDG